jgi:dolichyl-phosphate-mannose--protein O-mannosyl transferase
MSELKINGIIGAYLIATVLIFNWFMPVKFNGQHISAHQYHMTMWFHSRGEDE